VKEALSPSGRLKVTKNINTLEGLGLQAYRARRWGKALTLFQAALQEVPNDYPSQLYIQRCQEFQITPPRDDWDGVYAMQTK
jgi:adenylate cyclase